jgi:hypothetical protein
MFNELTYEPGDRFIIPDRCMSLKQVIRCAETWKQKTRLGGRVPTGGSLAQISTVNKFLA